MLQEKIEKNPSFQINTFWQKSAIDLSLSKLQNYLGDTILNPTVHGEG